MSEDCALGSLGKYLGGIGRRGSPYREKEQKEKFAQRRVEQRQRDVRKPGDGQRSERSEGRAAVPELLSNARRRGRSFLAGVVPVEKFQCNVAPQRHSAVESERLWVEANTRVSKKKKREYHGSGGLTYDAPDKDAKAELGFDLRPRDSFRFAPEHVTVDVLTERLPSWCYG